MKLDLNCDLGEGEPLARTRALMRSITSANVACGGHAGTLNSMETCVRLAASCDVRLGAHPGPWNKDDFGRGAMPGDFSPDALELLLVHQVGALDRIAQAHGVRLHHVKLHGALYHATEADDALARRYLAAIRRWWPRCVIYAQAGGRVARLARLTRRAGSRTGQGVDVWEEAFADRAYRDDGALVPRGEPGAVLRTTREVLARARLVAANGAVECISGRRLMLRPRTLCVHSDSPQAVGSVRQLARIFFSSGR